MEKTFDPASVESRIAERWEAEGAFRAGRPERAGAATFTVVIPPPNVTGSLHMGHALNNTLQDILCRFERMRGKDVLWQPGTDHAGIATQMVVERQLLERQEPGRQKLGREKFLQKVWAWKNESGGAIVNQLKRLGASCDWSRERFTMDEGLSRAVVKVFVQLHKEGLIYKDKRLVNWDPQLLTAISDLEVVQLECKGTFKWSRSDEVPFDGEALGKVLSKNPNGHLYYFDYPVVDGAGNATDEVLTVATTRPETMLGDTAVAVHPDDERYKHLVGKKVRLPLVGRLIPIIADAYADPDKGSGAVKITPAHDFNDFDVGKRHDLPRINVLDPEARLTLRFNEAFLEGLPPLPGADDPINPSNNQLDPDITEVLHLDGWDRFEARERIVEMMGDRGLLDKVEATIHAVPQGDRSGAVLEPRLTDQWYVKADILAEPALEAVRAGKTKFIPETWEKTYFQWLENIQPWCISRQLWWGHQIPAWYGPDGEIFVAENEADALAQAQKFYAKGEPPALTRDPDVLDTWFSSALWPFSTLGWPDETPELARYYPTNALVTGFDIIFFWVARMMMMGLHFQHEVPFHDVYIHALVRDEKGAKMSKSKGNVIDPLALIDNYGADSLRFTLAAMAAQGRDIKLSTQRVEGYRNFATKLWNAARFAELNLCIRTAAFAPKDVAIALNKWIIGEAAKACADITAAILAYRFNDAANIAYRFVWNIFCDWYLELAKPLLQGHDEAAKAETRATTAFMLDEIAKLLHPFMPFITEELWAIKGAEGPPRAGLLALAPWPQLDGLEDAQAESEIGFIVELVSEIRSVRAEMNVPAAAQIPLVLAGAAAAVESRVKSWDETIKRMARLSDIAFAAQPPAKSVQMIVRGTLACLPLEGIIDFAAEKARLAKEIDRLKGEAKKTEAKLANADFVARAPEEVVEENRERLAEARARQEKLAAALEKLR
jgi:valyl-tRNA synthetase